MRIFKLSCDIRSPVYEITENNYLEKTKKAQPFFNSKEKKYYAICPDCNNPISIISLFNDRTLNNKKNPVRLHGRHVKKNVKGVAVYNQETYNDCDLKNAKASKLSEKGKSTKKANEIIKLIDSHLESLFWCIQRILGLNISYNSFKKMLNDFVVSEGHYYRRVTKWNLPYSLLYMQGQISLYKRYIKENEMGQKIKAALEQSTFFKVENNQIIQKSDKEFSKIYFYTPNHRVDNETGEEIMEIIIEEKSPDITKILIRRNIEINHLLFMNQIAMKDKEGKI